METGQILNELRDQRLEFNDKLEKILIQTTKTNGRVDNLMQFKEDVQADLNAIKEYVNITKGKDAGKDKVSERILTALGAVAIVLLTWVLSKYF